MDKKSDRRDVFKSWATTARLLQRRGCTSPPTTSPATHLLLNGGRLCVRAQDEAYFLAKYAGFLTRGDPVFVVELRTGVFRLMFDLDIKSARVVPMQQLKDIAAHVQSQVAMLFPDVDAILLASLTTPHRTADAWKTGLHLNFPTVSCHVPLALAVRDVLLRTCPHAFPTVGPWDDVLDASVFRQSGLRMIGSRKLEHPHVYTPTWRLDGERIADIDMTPPDAWHRMVKLTSIRCPHDAPSPTTLACASPTPPGPQPCPTPSGSLAVLDHLKPHLPPVFRDMCFTRLRQAGDKFFAQTDCRHCLNADREHGSSRVWFQLHADGVYQRCHSPKAGEGRYKGSCKTFYSNMFPMPDVVRDALWPDTRRHKKERV